MVSPLPSSVPIIICFLSMYKQHAERTHTKEKSLNPFSPGQFINMQILLILFTQNTLFGNENKVNDHTQKTV